MTEAEPGEKLSSDRLMENTMQKTMDNIRARESEPKEPAQHKEAEAPVADAAASEQPAKPETVTRDAAGKFKPKDQKAAKSAAEPEAPKQSDDPAKEGEAPKSEDVVPQKAASQAPSSWSPAAKAKWDALDPTIRAEVLKRESDAQRGIQQFAEKAKRLDAIDAVVQPKQRDQLKGHYGSFENGIKELLALSDFAGQNPYGFVSYFMQQRSLDPKQLLDILQRGAPQGNAQPALPQPPQAVNPLEARMAAIEQNFTKTQNQGIETTIQNFKGSTDASGELLHPHFDELRNEIAAFLEMGKNLQEAYDSAVWASPAHREQILQKQNDDVAKRAEADKKVKAAEQEKLAKEARQASTVAQVTRPNTGATASKPADMWDTLKKHQTRLAGTA